MAGVINIQQDPRFEFARFGDRLPFGPTRT